MRRMQRLFAVLFVLAAAVLLPACGEPGPQGETGPQGEAGETPYINDDGYWVIGDTVTDVRAAGSVFSVDEEGYLCIDGVKTDFRLTNEAMELVPYEFYPLENESGEIEAYAFGIGRARYRSRVEIPESFLGKPVTMIASEAFSSCYDMTVIIPASVTTVDYQAFIVAKNIAMSYLGDHLFFEEEATLGSLGCTIDAAEDKLSGDYKGFQTGVPLTADS